MPKKKTNKKLTAKLITEALKNQCKYLIRGDEKRQIAAKIGVSVAQVNYVIAGDRKNDKILDALQEKVNEKLLELKPTAN